MSWLRADPSSRAVFGGEPLSAVHCHCSCFVSYSGLGCSPLQLNCRHALLLRGECNCAFLICCCLLLVGSHDRFIASLYWLMRRHIRGLHHGPAVMMQQVLEVGASADDAVIKKAYRVQALQWHPGAPPKLLHSVVYRLSSTVLALFLRHRA